MPNVVDLQVMEADVSKNVKRVKACKAAGPDVIPSWVLQTYYTQLSQALTDIFTVIVCGYNVYESA